MQERMIPEQKVLSTEKMRIEESPKQEQEDLPWY